MTKQHFNLNDCRCSDEIGYGSADDTSGGHATAGRSCTEGGSKSGEALTFTGEQKEWAEWSFQFTAYMGSANPKSIEALRWAATEDAKITTAAVVQQSFEEHKGQLYLALALLCKGSALITVKNFEVNNGPEAWRGLNDTHDSNNKGRQ